MIINALDSKARQSMAELDRYFDLEFHPLGSACIGKESLVSCALE